MENLERKTGIHEIDELLFNVDSASQLHILEQIGQLTEGTREGIFLTFLDGRELGPYNYSQQAKLIDLWTSGRVVDLRFGESTVN